MKKIVGGGLAILCLVLLGAAPASDRTECTVGEFAVRLAEMVTQKTDYTPETAQALLDNLGVKLDAGLEDVLREETLVGTLNQLGADLRTSNPDRSMNAQDAQRILGMFDALGSGSTEASQGPQSIKCKSGVNKGEQCITDADCPGSYCNIPPGQAKKIATPTDG